MMEAGFSTFLFAKRQARTPRHAFAGMAGGNYRLSQRRANPRSPCGMKITIAMKMMPTGIR